MTALAREILPVHALADVCVIGLGYVGLPTAVLLAGAGMHVVGVDIDAAKVARINQGKAPIVEPGLELLLERATRTEMLHAATEMPRAETYVICVPTPLSPNSHTPDVSYVAAAADALAHHLPLGALVILESTSPVGTTETIVADALERRGFTVGRDVFVAYAPERVLPGAALHEIVHNARVVGGVTPACTHKAVVFYKTFVQGEVVGTTAKVAELTKLAENAFRDVNIAFSNELANVCEHVEADVWEVVRLANRHPRVNILRPGPGVGGHCIAVDPWFLIAGAPEQTPLLRISRLINDRRPHQLVAKIRGVAAKLVQPTIACLGLSYKPDIDDLRESPALEIVQELARERLGTILAVEPHLTTSPVPGATLMPASQALAHADIVVILVAHKQFFPLRTALKTMHHVIDAAGLLEPEK